MEAPTKDLVEPPKDAEPAEHLRYWHALNEASEWEKSERFFLKRRREIKAALGLR